ncbi:MAG: hypothetical protein GVY15_05605 [Bacteroidetes bacterium]|jgi:hypothetical protein|nr:hypothetical protein [Bacteroidota bacterium]
MKTTVLIGSPMNLFVWDYGRYGMGSAPFYGDAEAIRESWSPVRQNALVGSSKGTIYAPPEPREVTVVNSAS